MKSLCIRPYKFTSEAAILLKKTLGCNWYDENTRLGRDVVCINWGTGDGFTYSPTGKVINKPSAVCNAIYKLKTFSYFKRHEVKCPEVTQVRAEAERWLAAGNIVYGRSTDHGMDGLGIKILQAMAHLRDDDCSQFFTKRFNAEREFRINVAFGKAIDVCEKKRRTGTSPDPLVKCGDDWVYCRNNLRSYSNELLKQAEKAVSALGLDFGGVDIGYNSDGDVCVFEVNTAPWLGTIIANKYAEEFKAYANQQP